MVTQIIGHRGSSHIAPENTMAAFKLAYQSGANGIETDVHLTKDQIPVLIHDIDVNRTTNGSDYIKNLTFAELKQLDAGSWFSEQFVGERILALDELLVWIKRKELSLHIELKNAKMPYKNLEFITYELLDHYDLLHRTTISTFNEVSIKRMKRLTENVEIALLRSRRHKHIVKHLSTIGAHALHIKYHPLHWRMIDQCLQADIPVRVYTVNKRRQMLRCFQRKCTGIFTDMPDRGVKYRKLIHGQ